MTGRRECLNVPALLASVLLTSDTTLWTIDKNLNALSTRLGVDFRG
jgi:hypothetical protein